MKKLISRIVILILWSLTINSYCQNLNEKIVYVLGDRYDDGNICYWRNGTAINITDGSRDAYVNSIFVSDGDVYVVGTEYSDIGPHNGKLFLKYWKNGTGVNLYDMSHYGVLDAGPYIYVSGNDVYVLETVDYVVRYWKNGEMVILNDSTEEQAWGYSIFVSGNDVYVSGNGGPGMKTAKYWKNGIAVDLTDGTHHAMANSIFVSDGDVYVAGGEYTGIEEFSGKWVAKYWKNGIPVALTDGTETTIAQSIFVSENDIYVIGGNGNGRCWKNDEDMSINDCKYPKSIYVFDNDVYLAGFPKIDQSNATYWENGMPIILENGSDMFTLSVFVSDDLENTSIAVSDSLISLGSDTAQVFVNSNTTWTASSDQSWLIVNPSSGSGNAQLNLYTNEAKETISNNEAIVSIISSTGTTIQTITVTQNGGTTGVNETDLSLASIFPNPVTNELSVSNICQNATILIYDVNGKLLFNKTAKSTIEKIDVSGLTKGVYSISIIDKKAIKAFKFLKQI